MKWLVFFLFFLSHNVFAGFLADGFSSESKVILFEDLKRLSLFSSPLNNKWVYNGINLFSGNGQSLYNYIQDLSPSFVGVEFEFKPCYISNSNTEINKLDCRNHTFVEKNNLSTSVEFKMIDPVFSVVFPYLMLPDNDNLGKGVFLSKGDVLQLKNKEDPFFLIKLENSNISKGLDSVSSSWYRIAHYIGMSRAVYLFKQNKPIISTCETVFGSYIYCDINKYGPYAVTGILLRDFAAVCNECSEQSKIIIFYVACDYLLRSPGDEELQSIAYKIINENETKMKLIGLDTDRLLELYRWSLTTNEHINN